MEEILKKYTLLKDQNVPRETFWILRALLLCFRKKMKK